MYLVVLACGDYDMRFEVLEALDYAKHFFVGSL